MSDPTYDKLYKLIQQQLKKDRGPLDLAEDTWPKAKEILEAIWPVIATIKEEGFVDGYALGLGNPLGPMDDHGKPV